MASWIRIQVGLRRPLEWEYGFKRKVGIIRRRKIFEWEDDGGQDVKNTNI